MNSADEIKGQTCPACLKPTLILRQEEIDIPYFGRTYILLMDCSSCKFRRSEVEAAEEKPPVRYTLEIDSEKDMNIRVVRSSQGTIKIPHIGSLECGDDAEGFVSNIEGVLQRFKAQIEAVKEGDDEPQVQENARNLIKKINRIIYGNQKTKMIIEDPSGNSAIISEKAGVQTLKK